MKAKISQRRHQRYLHFISIYQLKQLRKMYTFSLFFSKQNPNSKYRYTPIVYLILQKPISYRACCRIATTSATKKSLGFFCTTFFVLFTGTVARPQLLIILVEVVCKIQMVCVCVCVQHMGKSCTEYLNKPTQYMYLLTFLAAVLNSFQFYPIVLATK